MSEIFTNSIVVSALIFGCAFLIGYLVLPRISWMVNYYNLSDKPNHRSSHKEPIPTLGGIAFFIVLVLVIFFISDWDYDHISLNLLTALMIIFLIGLKDDLAMATARARLIVEFVAICIIFYHSDFQMKTFDGFLGFHEAPQFLIDIFCIIIFMVIINAYNLIDGINGLAATLGVIICSIYSHIFYKAELPFYFFISISMTGVLFAFLRYNFSIKKNIFMGDTGSLIIGFIISFLSLKFISMETVTFSNFKFTPENKFIVIASIVCIPLFDLFRVFGVRLLTGKNPFKADRNHIHHILVDRKIPHYKTTMILGSFNYCFTIVMVFLSSYFNSYIMLSVLLFFFCVYIYTAYILKKSIS